MRKISVRIIVMNLSIFVLVFGVFFYISINNLSNVITQETKSNLNEQLNVWAKEYDALFIEGYTFFQPIKAYLEDHLTLEILKDNERSSEVFAVPTETAISSVRKANLVDLYCWLAPEFVDDIYGSSIQNYSLDRNVVAVNPGPYTRAEMQGASWQWFTGAEKNGMNITLPYKWEGIEGLIISYTEALEVEGKVVGVVGTDFKVDTFEKKLQETRILKTGYFSLADENLEFIFHPEHSGKKISEVFKSFSEKDFRVITDEKSSSGNLTLGTGKGQQIIAYKRLFNGWYLLGFPTTSEIYESLNRVTAILITILLVSMVIVSAAATVVGISISRPLRKVAGSLEEIAKGGGDLTTQITVKSKDETSLLAGNFNKFISNLKIIVSNIKNSSNMNKKIGESLNDSSTNAASASIEISKNVTSIEGQIEKLNNYIIDTTSGIEEIGANISQFKNQIEEQVSAVEESSASVEQMIASLDNVSAVTNKKLESTKRLVNTTKQGESLLYETSSGFKEGIADRIDNIKEMVEVIGNIAERTNLLAMNAAIEASHAGEAGKGFAVVADEIRKMAEEAASSSLGISEIIAGIISAIENTDSNVDNTSKAFKIILNEVSEIDIALNEIASNTIELASGGQEILKSVALLNDTTSHISHGINEIETGSTSITESMGNIQDISSEVFSGVQEITYGVKNVSSSFEEVADLAKELDDESKKLSSEVDRFIIE